MRESKLSNKIDCFVFSSISASSTFANIALKEHQGKSLPKIILLSSIILTAYSRTCGVVMPDVSKKIFSRSAAIF